MVLEKCKPFDQRKRCDFGYCTAVDYFINKLIDDIKFFKEKLNEPITPITSPDKEVFEKAIDRCQKELEKWNKEKIYCDETRKNRARRSVSK